MTEEEEREAFEEAARTRADRAVPWFPQDWCANRPRTVDGGAGGRPLAELDRFCVLRDGRELELTPEREALKREVSKWDFAPKSTFPLADILEEEPAPALHKRRPRESLRETG